MTSIQKSENSNLIWCLIKPKLEKEIITKTIQPALHGCIWYTFKIHMYENYYVLANLPI